jgi:hypothetical protein
MTAEQTNAADVRIPMSWPYSCVGDRTAGVAQPLPDLGSVLVVLRVRVIDVGRPVGDRAVHRGVVHAVRDLTLELRFHVGPASRIACIGHRVNR